MTDSDDTSRRLRDLLKPNLSGNLSRGDNEILWELHDQADSDEADEALGDSPLNWLLRGRAGVFRRLFWKQVAEISLYMAQAKRFYSVYPSGDLLEFPVVGGSLAGEELDERDSGMVVLADSSEEALHRVSERLDGVSDVALLRTGNLQLPFRNDAFGGALCQQVWLGEAESTRLFKQFAGVLRPGGKLWISLYCRGQSKRLDFLAGSLFGISALTVGDYIHLAEDAGLHLDEQWHYGPLYQLEFELH